MLTRMNKSIPMYFDDFLGRDFMPDFISNFRSSNTPAVNVIENDDDFVIEVAAPGLEKKDFNINLENDCLTISSEKEEKSGEKDERYSRKEFSYSSFSRSFNLPDSVDSDKIRANHKNGVLTISVPKKEEARVKPARAIEVS